MTTKYDHTKLHGVLTLVIAAKHERTQMLQMICDDLEITKQLNKSQSLLREGCSKIVNTLFNKYGKELHNIPGLQDMNKLLAEERMNLLILTLSGSLLDLSKQEFDTQYSN